MPTARATGVRTAHSPKLNTKMEVNVITSTRRAFGRGLRPHRVRALLRTLPFFSSSTSLFDGYQAEVIQQDRGALLDEIDLDQEPAAGRGSENLSP